MTGKTKILVIDDDPELRELLRMVLSKDGYEILEAEDGKTGLAQAASALPHLMIVDMMMPRMSGREFLVEARGRAELKHIPIIISPALKSDDEARHCLALGAAAYMPKPLNFDQLRAEVKALLGHQR